jgi:cysteine desulfurase
VQKQIYFDHNATTPIRSEVLQKIPHWLSQWGNASSIHWAGRGPKTILRDTRQSFADLVGCHPLEVVFTSGGSESNNLALKGVFQNLRLQNPQAPLRFLVGAMEHPSITKTCLALMKLGLQIDTIPVLRSGEVDLESYERLLTDSTRPKVTLVSHMTANNETGVVFPIKKMVKLARQAGALFHTDAVQALGKIPLSLEHLDVDFASFSAHKFYSLKGSGVLCVKKGLQIEPLIHGGGQERQRRGGTENILAIAALGEMCKQKDEVLIQYERVTKLRNSLEAQMRERVSGILFTGAQCKRVPNTSSVIIPEVDGETLLMNLDMEGFAVSTGAACSSGSPEPSPGLLAMGLTRKEAQSSLRISLGWSSTEEEVELFLQKLEQIVVRVRSLNNSK